MKLTASASQQFDDTDWQIVNLLKVNGRITNQEIAATLKLTRSVVATRIQRMTDSGSLRIVAATDFAAYGYNVLVALEIKVVGRSVQAVADELAEFQEMFAVHIVTGAAQIEALIGMHRFEDLSETLMPKMIKVAGLARIEVGIVTDIVTYNFDVGIPR